MRCPSLNSPCWAARRHSAASRSATATAIGSPRGTLELRIPISSPRNIGRAGIAIFADSGATYDAHTTLDHAKFDTGIGAGWFLQLPVLSFRIDVAHGLGGSTRAHVTLGVTF